jgi:hypothetical protein
MTHIQTVDVIFAVVLADVTAVDLDAAVGLVVDSVAADAAVVVAVVVAAVAGAAVAGALNSALVLYLESLWLHYFSSSIVKS